jgi:hypothetical protein
VIEALSCGLPTIYIASGGHHEVVGAAGLAFTEREEIPTLLEEMVRHYDSYQAHISAPFLPDIANRYLAVMGIPAVPD